MKVAFVFTLVLFFNCSVAQSQKQNRQSGLSATSSLKVTVTVVPSVWLVMEPDGKQNLVVANAPDPKESFSPARAVKSGAKRAAQSKRQPSSAMPRKPLPDQDDRSVQFSFPTVSKQFDVTQKTVIMNVSEGGKTVARPVIVTTVVAQ